MRIIKCDTSLHSHARKGARQKIKVGVCIGSNEVLHLLVEIGVGSEFEVAPRGCLFYLEELLGWKPKIRVKSLDVLVQARRQRVQRKQFTDEAYEFLNLI